MGARNTYHYSFISGDGDVRPVGRADDDMTDDGDPRLADEYVRELPGSGSLETVVLVGVVHDHPASKYRARTVIESVEPDVLALELPPVALPLYEAYADDPRTPPAFGGEMSAAVQAADGGAIVGIDGPSADFLIRLLGTLSRDRAAPGTVGRVLRSLWTVTKRAAVCRLAAGVARRTGVRLEVDAPSVYDCRWSDDPRAQAKDERDQVRRARAVSNLFGTPDAVRVRETVREAHMAARLSSLRREGAVVAVVGIDHLDPLADRLRDGAPAPG